MRPVCDTLPVVFRSCDYAPTAFLWIRYAPSIEVETFASMILLPLSPSAVRSHRAIKKRRIRPCGACRILQVRKRGWVFLYVFIVSAPMIQRQNYIYKMRCAIGQNRQMSTNVNNIKVSLCRPNLLFHLCFSKNNLTTYIADCQRDNNPLALVWDQVVAGSNPVTPTAD